MGESDVWRTVRNWAADVEGGIHHDATARQKGFPAGLVPGDAPLAVVTGRLVPRLGPVWYERGFLRHVFVRPLYNGEAVRVAVDERPPGPDDETLLEWRLLRRDNRDGDDGEAVVGAGIAGIGFRPPWERNDQPATDSGERDPLPDEPLGFVYPERTPHVELGDCDRSLDGNDESPWYRDASPWGPPVVPTVGIFNIAHRIRADVVPDAIWREMRAGVNAKFEVQHLGPMFYGRPYHRRATLVEKGVDGRYAFRTIEFTLDDMESGARVARARWKIAWVTTQR